MTTASTYSEKPEADKSAESEQTHHSGQDPKQSEAVSTWLESIVGPIWLHGRPPATDQALVAVSQVALRQIEGHGASNLGTELGGVLLGRAIPRKDLTLVHVFAAIPVKTGDRGPVHFTFTADTWAQLHEDRAELYPELDVVGWYHTHPGLGVFYSADDIVVHSAAFALPWHVGLVVDPVHNEGSFFGWQYGRSDTDEKLLIPIDGFYEILDQSETSVASWKDMPSSVWHQGGYVAHDMGAAPGSVYTADDEWPSLPAISPWWGVLLGGTALFISLLLLIERILASIN